MKVPTRLIAGLGILMISASPLLQAAPQDQRGPDDNRPGQQQGADHGKGPQNGGNDQHGNDRGPGPGDNRQQPDRQDNHSDNRGDNRQQQGHQDNRGGNRPPQNFDQVRQTFHQHRDMIGRGQPLPPGIYIREGHPLPRGYGKRLDSRSLQYLPRYDGYEWRRVGPDVVLIAVATGVIYTILNGVLN
jgi:Ni/Co efflux regulator RcnB